MIKPGFALPSRIERRLFTPNNAFVDTKIELHSDLSAVIEQKFRHTGARTQFYRGAWKGQSQEDLERSIVEGLSSDLPEVKLVGMELDGLDSLTPEFSFTLRYEVPNYVMEAANLQIVRVPWFDPYEPVSALGYEQRVYPYEFTNTIDTILENITITVPEGYEPLGLKNTEAFNHATGSVARTASSSADTLHLTRKAMYHRNVVMPAEYTGYRTFYNNVLRADRQSLLFAPKGTVVNAPKKRSTKKTSK